MALPPAFLKFYVTLLPFVAPYIVKGHYGGKRMRMEDGCIIQECLNGKPQAFGMLVDKYKEGIFAFVYADLRNFHDAQDVTQEVFLQAYRDLRGLRRYESFAFWLYRIAYRCCAQWFRRKSRATRGARLDVVRPVSAPRCFDAGSVPCGRRSGHPAP